jgi:hypothetical protein
MKPIEKLVIDAVAAEYCGTWRCGEDPPDAYLMIGDREIPIEISTLIQQPRISDDMGAVGLVGELNLELGGLVPKGVTILLTFSAPIAERRKTKVALTDFLREKLVDIQSFTDETRFDANENVVSIRPIQGRKGQKKIIGTILPQCSETNILYNVSQILGNTIVRKTKTCSSLVGKKPLWLALLNEYPLASALEYKDVLSQFSTKHPFEKIVVVSRDGTVSEL